MSDRPRRSAAGAGREPRGPASFSAPTLASSPAPRGHADPAGGTSDAPDRRGRARREQAGEGDGAAPDPLDPLQGWLLVAALAALCLPPPWGLFDGAPDTASLGAGLGALLALPALAVAVLRVAAAGVRVGVPLGLPILLGLAGYAASRAGGATDTFEAERALLALVGASAYVAAAASLGAAGRRALQVGLPFTAALLLVSVLLEGGPSGALGNSGDLSEAALVGAVVGGGAFLRGPGAIGVLGLVTLAGFALHAGLTPVHAGTLGLGAAAAAALVASFLARAATPEGRGAAARRARLLLVAALVATAAAGARAALAPAGDADATPRDPERAPLDEPADAAPADPGIGGGGVRFRLLTWARIDDVLTDHGRLGLGPGQFEAGFPPYRDPAEIEVSTFGRREPTPVDVEHAHSEPLTALAEYGWIGGGAFALLLALVVLRAGALLAGEDDTRRDLAAAAIAVVAVSLVNAPLLHGPAAPALAFTAFGAVLASRPTDGSRRLIDLLGLAIPLAAVALLGRTAVSFVAHGRALARVPEARIVLADGREQLDPDRLDALLRDALEARPDSPVALEKRAQLLSRVGAPIADRREVMGRLLTVRPNSVAALVNAGTLEARSGEFRRAGALFDAAAALDGASPLVLGNLMQVAIDLRDPARAEAALEALRSAGRLVREDVRRDAREALLGGRVAVAAPIVSTLRTLRGEDPIDPLDANDLYGAGEAARDGGDGALADAYRAAYRTVAALAAIRAGDPDGARIDARRAYQAARDAGVDTSAVRLRLAAALAMNGDEAGARAALDEAPVRPVDVRRLHAAEEAALDRIGVSFDASAASPR